MRACLFLKPLVLLLDWRRPPEPRGVLAGCAATSAVGWASGSCASIRAGLDGFVESRDEFPACRCTPERAREQAIGGGA
jgi:hypothetical protein